MKRVYEVMVSYENNLGVTIEAESEEQAEELAIDDIDGEIIHVDIRDLGPVEEGT